MTYQQRQHAVLPFLFFLAIALFVVVTSLVFDGMVQLINVLLVLIGVVVLLFSRLTVSVDDTNIEAAFGLGWPMKVIAHTDVTEAVTVRNKWWYGLGIRLIPDGWMYNVWGLDAVELSLTSGKKFRIGTAEPDDLLAVIKLHQSGN